MASESEKADVTTRPRLRKGNDVWAPPSGNGGNAARSSRGFPGDRRRGWPGVGAIRREQPPPSPITGSRGSQNGDWEEGLEK
jgi:hypothetical protein